jgi:hypothetical protein
MQTTAEDFFKRFSEKENSSEKRLQEVFWEINNCIGLLQAVLRRKTLMYTKPLQQVLKAS